MSEKNKYNFFINYSINDLNIYKKITSRLDDFNLSYFHEKDNFALSDSQSSNDFIDIFNQCVHMLCIWTSNYFRDFELLKKQDYFLNLKKKDSEYKNQIIPLLFENIKIPQALSHLDVINFVEDNFDLQFCHITKLFETSNNDSIEDSYFKDFIKDEFNDLSFFTDEIKEMYRLLDFSVKKESFKIVSPGFIVERQIEGISGFHDRAVIILRKQLNKDDIIEILNKQEILNKKYKEYKIIIFALKQPLNEITNMTRGTSIIISNYVKLFSDLINFNSYIVELLKKYNDYLQKKWNGIDCYIKPDFILDSVFKEENSFSFINNWFQNSQSNMLLILGDIGAGKTLLCHYIAYWLSVNFKKNPYNNPAPVFIPLKEVRKEISLEGMIINHFAKYSISIDYKKFSYLHKHGRIIIIFDGLDEMADRTMWEITHCNFRQLQRASDLAGKAIITSRTIFFTNKLIKYYLDKYKNFKTTIFETILYKEFKRQSNTDIVYIRDFDNEQKISYLKKLRPASFKIDWEIINNNIELKKLSEKPLLLDLIIKCLDHIDFKSDIDICSLYSIFTNKWIEKEEIISNDFSLNARNKQAICFQIAWHMWHEKKDIMNFFDLIPFIEKIKQQKISNLLQQKIILEISKAQFLMLDEFKNLYFLHRSFMDFFLAKRMYISLLSLPSSIKTVLNTRRYDRKIIIFLVFLDKSTQKIIPLLQNILTNEYEKNISENALQVLYWYVRVNNKMERFIHDINKLQIETSKHVPEGIKLGGASLQEIVLEGANMKKADFSCTDLTRANLNDTILEQASFKKSNLSNALLRNTVANGADFSYSNIINTEFYGADLTDSNFNQASMNGYFVNTKGTDKSFDVNYSKLKPVIQAGFSSAVNFISFSHDNDLIGIGCNDGTCLIYRLNDMKILWDIEYDITCINSISFSNDSNYCAICGDRNFILIWDLKKGRIANIFTGHSSSINSLDFSPVELKLVSGGQDKKIIIWDLMKKEAVLFIYEHYDAVTSVKFSHDGKNVASCGSNGKLFICDASSGKLLNSTTYVSNTLNTLEYSKDGKKIAFISQNKTINIFNLPDFKCISKISNNTSHINAIKFTPDSKNIIGAGGDKKLYLWDILTGKLLKSENKHTLKITSIDISNDGTKIVSASMDRSFCIWDSEKFLSLLTIKNHNLCINAISFSSDGNIIISGGSDCYLKSWNLKLKNPHLCLKDHKKPIKDLCFFSGGKSILTASDDHSVGIWTSIKAKKLIGHTDSVNSVHAFSNAKTIISAGRDKAIRLWTLNDDNIECSKILSNNKINCVKCPNNGNFFAATAGKKIIIIDLKSKKIINKFEYHDDIIKEILFSPDSYDLASCSIDKTIIIWNLNNGNKKYVLKEHHDQVNCIDYNNKGSMLASGSRDKTIRIWDTNTGKCIKVLKYSKGEIQSIKFSPNGKYLLSAGTSGRLEFWDYISEKIFLYRYIFGPSAWLDLLPEGIFSASPEGFRYLNYTETDTCSSYNSEELINNFYKPDKIKKILDNYI